MTATSTLTISEPNESGPDLSIKNFGDGVTSVVAATSPPPAGSYIEDTLKYWRGKYYYVPTEYIHAFSDLWLTIIARKPPGTTGGASSSAAKATQKILQNLNLNQTNQSILSQ